MEQSFETSHETETDNVIKQSLTELQKTIIDNKDLPPYHSEGLERHISTIKIGHIFWNNPRYFQELQKIGKELWFSVEPIDACTYRSEDTAIIRSDRKVYFPYAQEENRTSLGDYYSLKRKKVSDRYQGQTYHENQWACMQDHWRFDTENLYPWTSYLEGGNVLNTLTADGEPWAIIWEESIQYTLKAMNLQDTSSNQEQAKKQIAKDLGLSLDQIIFIPQFDFHIDMFYRPLHNGEIGVPDYEAWIQYLKDIHQTIMSWQDTSHDNFLSVLEEKIQDLKILNKKTESFRNRANKLLESWGYRLTKIPCFSLCWNWRKKAHPINYSNWIGGTTLQWETYYLTNTSWLPFLDQKMEEYFHSIWIDKIYFLSTQDFLREGWWIDCLTLELSDVPQDTETK